MTNEEQKIIAQSMDDIITTVLDGPRGGPDYCHISAAESCYDLIDQLDLHAAMRDVNYNYDQRRSDFYGDDSEADEEHDA